MGQPALVNGVWLAQETCCNCGVKFGLAHDYKEERLKDHRNFSCPNGHQQHYTGETEADRLKKELENEKRRHEFTKNQSEMHKRSASANKGLLTKIKNRVKHGVCPCCNRSFINLARHMKTKHEGYGK